jgi:choline/glycine/proline betaine transport protein
MTEKTSRINKVVFYTSSAIVISLVAIATAIPEASTTFFRQLQASVVEVAGWFYVGIVAAILLSVLYFGLGRYGDVKLGPDHSSPSYSGISWFAMLFSAGIGIGLLFFGVAEPVMHLMSPPHGVGGDVDAAREAMNLTFFHWGLHAWAIYALVGLALAYYGYRHNLPLTLRSALYPLLGDRVHGGWGNAIDIFAIIGTIMGVATSLGYGVAQINAGLGYLLNVSETLGIQFGLIILITLFAMASVLSGLDKGIKRLSEINMVLALLLLLTILLAGPTVYLLKALIQNMGNYLSDFVSKTFNLYAYDPTDWLGGWTIFYWGWWISWSPFVGMFIARISRGRTIRQFVLGVLFVPAGFTFVWMTVFGNSAFDIIANEGMALANAVESNNAVALFTFLEYFPFSTIISAITILMIVIFFVTSADSGALVVNMLSSGGEDKTPVWQRVYWTSIIGVSAAILLAAGGLGALQTATILSALPFCLILLLMIQSLFRSLNLDHQKKQSLLYSVTTRPFSSTSSEDSWVERIDIISSMPQAQRVKEFISTTVRVALDAVSEALDERGYQTRVQELDDGIELEILHGEEIDFLYRVRMRRLQRPDFVYTGTQEKNQEHYYRAEVYLKEGGQDYCVMGYSKEQIINDVLDNYEKHRHFLNVIRS